MSLDTNLLLQAGAGGVGGYLLGRGAKLITKLILNIVAVVAAGLTLFLAALANQGYITVNWTKMASDIQAWGAGLLQFALTQGPGIVASVQNYLATYLPIAGTGIAGFAYALHKKA